jgi:DNA (cytosine-5)-methyltransferase 1
LADKLKPRWIVWENVPGVLSSNGGRDFGSFVGALGQLGYGWAMRILDAQHFGVPQRRRRVFVVACLGDWRAAAEVLSLREGLRGYLETGNKKRKGPAADAGTSPAAGCWWDGGQVSQTLDAVLAKGQTMPEKNRFPAVLHPFRKSKRACSTTDNETCVPADASNTLNNFDLGDTRTTHAVVQPVAWTQNQREEVRLLGDKVGAIALPGTHQTNYIAEPVHTMPGSVAPTIGASGPPYSRTGNERVEAEALAITFQPGNLRREAGADPSFTTTTTLKASAGDQTPHVCYPLKDPNDIACEDDRRQNGIGNNGDPAFTLRTAVKPGVMTSMAVRRLTPVECERLQGFPDNWSRIRWKGKPEEQCPDGPRYKACGNSMAVPVMAFIGRRIAEVDATL